MSVVESAKVPADFSPTVPVLGFRFLSWTIVGTLFSYLINIYFNYWHKWPSASAAFGQKADLAAWLQVGIYALAVIGPALFVMKTKHRTLRQDNEAITAIAAYVARFAFWMVFLIGLADAVISFLRVEGLLSQIVGSDLELQLGRNQFRAPYVHLPLALTSLVLAAVTRTLGFIWLALLVVVAELQIVISRFVFSYEQAFMGDLVRFWYGGLFLFASAYTLAEEGHVRVDVLYSAFSDKTKGLVNAVGSLILGLPLCWVILVVGMGQSTAIIASPILRLEVSQSGFGMYVKYLLASFLLIYASTMMIQFAGYLLQGVADFRGDPGKRQIAEEITH